MNMLETLVMVVDALAAPQPGQPAAAGAAPGPAAAPSGPSPSAMSSASARRPAPPPDRPSLSQVSQNAPRGDMNSAPAQPAQQPVGSFADLFRTSSGNRGKLGAALDELSQLSRPGGARPGPATPPRSEAPRRPAPQAANPASPVDSQARLLIRAMLQAAKADGRIDRDERARLLERMGQPDRETMAFLDTEMARPVDIPGLIAEVPKGAEAQVYMLSALAITLDEQVEAQYLHALAQGFGLDPQTVNAIHARLGVPPLYR